MNKKSPYAFLLSVTALLFAVYISSGNNRDIETVYKQELSLDQKAISEAGDLETSNIRSSGFSRTITGKKLSIADALLVFSIDFDFLSPNKITSKEFSANNSAFLLLFPFHTFW